MCVYEWMAQYLELQLTEWNEQVVCYIVIFQRRYFRITNEHTNTSVWVLENQEFCEMSTLSHCAHYFNSIKDKNAQPLLKGLLNVYLSKVCFCLNFLCLAFSLVIAASDFLYVHNTGHISNYIREKNCHCCFEFNFLCKNWKRSDIQVYLKNSGSPYLLISFFSEASTFKSLIWFSKLEPPYLNILTVWFLVSWFPAM